MQKMVGKYFKHQADLLPSFVDEVLAPYDAFASGSAPFLAFEDVDVHLFAGGLRLGDKLVESPVSSRIMCMQPAFKLAGSSRGTGSTSRISRSGFWI